MHKINNLFFTILICYSSFLFSGCQTLYEFGDGMMHGGVNAYNEGVDNEHEETQKVGFFATLIGGALKFFGWLGGGKQEGPDRPLPEVKVTQEKNSPLSSDSVSNFENPSITNGISQIGTSPNNCFGTDWIYEPAYGSSITQVTNSDQNIGNPEVKPIVNAARVPTKQRDPRQGNYNTARQLTGRNDRPSNPNVRNTGGRGQQVGSSPIYGQQQQPMQRPVQPTNQSPSRPVSTARAATNSNPPVSVRQGSTIVAQNPQVQANTIPQFAPKPRYSQVNKPTQSERRPPEAQPPQEIDEFWSNPSSKISSNFTVGEALIMREFIGFYHIPSETEKNNIVDLANALQEVRKAYSEYMGKDMGMSITSWIRPTYLNPGRLDSSTRMIMIDPNYSGERNYNRIAAGSSDSSPHVKGYAADILDRDRTLTDFLLSEKGQELLEVNGLWMENENFTPTKEDAAKGVARWVHLDLHYRDKGNRPDNRRRIFIPY